MPSKAKQFLAEWFRVHVKNPYPSTLERNYIMEKTQLTKLQVSRWLSSARWQLKHGVLPYTRSGPGRKSLFYGVRWHRFNQKWYAALYMEGKNLHLGYFNCEYQAARSYDAAVKNRGLDVAKPLNFP